MTMPVLGTTVYQLRGKNKFESGMTAGWHYELKGLVPLNSGIGSRLWKEIEKYFRKYSVSCIRGQIETMGQSNEEITAKKRFWKKMGFTIDGYDISKRYRSVPATKSATSCL
jgi:hypothetical protein